MSQGPLGLLTMFFMGDKIQKVLKNLSISADIYYVGDDVFCEAK